MTPLTLTAVLVATATAATDPAGGLVITSTHIGGVAALVVGALGAWATVYKIREGMRKETAAQYAEIKEPIERLTKSVEALDAKLQAELYPLHDQPLAAQVKVLRSQHEGFRTSIEGLKAEKAALSASISRLDADIAEVRKGQAEAPDAVRALGRELAGRLAPIEAGLKVILTSTVAPLDPPEAAVPEQTAATVALMQVLADVHQLRALVDVISLTASSASSDPQA